MDNPSTQRPTANETRKGILHAAKTLFVKKGFAGTSINEIATLANINQSLIYHHFKSKQNLWTAVKKHALNAFMDEESFEIEKILNVDDPVLVIEKLVHFRFDLYDRYPDMQRIIDWQFLEPNPYELRGINTETIDLLIALMENFQNQNKITPYYSADMILCLIFHTPIGFFKSYKNMNEGFEGDALTKRKQDYIQLCVDALTKSLIIPLH